MSFAVDIVAMVLAMPRSLFPAVAADRFPGSVGLLYAAIPIGSVLAGLASGWIGRVRRQGVALTCAIIGWGLSVAVAGIAHQLWLVLVLLAFGGAADLVSAVFRQTILQTYAPDEMRGRMQGVFIAVVAGGPRLGDVRAGTMAALTTVTVSWVGGGIACVVVVAARRSPGAAVLALRRPPGPRSGAQRARQQVARLNACARGDSLYQTLSCRLDGPWSSVDQCVR